MKRLWVRIGLGLVGVIVAAVCVLALMGMREDAGVSRGSIEIAAPRDRVWAWLDEPDKWKQWVSWVVDVQAANDVKGVGAKYIVTMNEPGSAEPVRLETEITEYDGPFHTMANVVFPGLFTGTQETRVLDLGGGRTRVEMVNRIHYTSAIVRLLEPLAASTATKKVVDDLAALKRLAEAEAKESAAAMPSKGKVLGIGGVFFKTADTGKLGQWYATHLGIQDQSMLPWRAHDNPAREHVTVWSLFPASSDYFGSSGATFMLNYIVDDVDALLTRLAGEGVKIDAKRQNEPYGKFAWVYDADGNKIELWQPL